MPSALIGWSGFVGGNLLRQRTFDERFNSTNIESIAGRRFDLAVCAGMPAEKWRANRFPAQDRACLDRLRSCLDKAAIDTLILISTVDVFGSPAGSDETCVPMPGNAYGAHRRMLEEFAAERFSTLIVRLPGLFGMGLKKNIVHDFLHGHQVDQIDSRAAYQFYNLERLWADVTVAREAGLSLVHFATEPVSVACVAREAFGRHFENAVQPVPARYDLRTCHQDLYGGPPGYLCDRHEVLRDLRQFVAQQRGEKQCA